MMRWTKHPTLTDCSALTKEPMFICQAGQDILLYRKASVLNRDERYFPILTHFFLTEMNYLSQNEKPLFRVINTEIFLNYVLCCMINLYKPNC